MIIMADPLTFDVHRKIDSLDIVLSSTMDYIDRADKLVKAIMDENGLGKHAFAVRVVMREGLTNSVRHGHNHDPGKLIRFNLTIKNNTLTMVIEDQGEGFDWREALAGASRETPEGSLKDHGRGFLIMGDYFDTWAYNDKGNVLTLVKNISP